MRSNQTTQRAKQYFEGKRDLEMVGYYMTTKTLTLQRGGFNLDTMSDVTLVKSCEFQPVETTKEALDRLGGDANKFLAIVNEGLAAETRRNLAADSNVAWMEVDEEDGSHSPFAGTLANAKAVSACILNLAKTAFGYAKDMDADKAKNRELKRASKDAALEFVKSSPILIAGLKRTAVSDDNE